MVSINTRRNANAHIDDLYQTHPNATKLALKGGVFKGIQSVYDPCNGFGGITKQLDNNGIKTVCSDMIDYGIGDEIINFLDVDVMPNVDAIAFNPPFKLTKEFMNKATDLCGKVIMFNRVSFLETVKRAKDIQGKWGLTDIYFHSARTGCSKGVEEEYGNAVFYAWYVFDNKNYNGKTEAHWLI